MAETYRWTRTFSEGATFSDDLGSLGISVGPRTGTVRRTQGQQEDYVLRRLLIAWKHRGSLRLPLTVHASDEAAPDFLLLDADGCRGLEVTEAGRREHQRQMTRMAREERETWLVSEDGWTPSHIVQQFRAAIWSNVRGFDEGKYAKPCELVVYNNTEDALDDETVQCVKAPGLLGRFEAVHLVDCDGNRVYLDVLGDMPERIDIAADYDIDLARWARDQIDLLRRRKLDRLDIENLIEELEALARRDRRELRSHLINLFAHLLKWHCQPQRRSGSWVSTIENSCDEVAGLVEDSPSLRRLLHPSGDLVGKAYVLARSRAIRETGLSPDLFPDACPWDEELGRACEEIGAADPLYELRQR